MENRFLTARRQERDALLERIVTALENDSRVDAAFLWGSLGRGTSDDLSDIDIWVVVQDNVLSDILNSLSEFAARIAQPLMIMEAPYNGPLGGTSFHTIYDGEMTGAQNVDWYIQPASTARFLPNTTVIFDNLGLQQSNDPDYPRNPDKTPCEIDGKLQNVRFFWLMLLICAKYAYRSPDEQRMGLLVYPVNVLNEVKQFLGLPSGPSAGEMPPQPDFASKIAVLRALNSEMIDLMDSFDELFPDEFSRSGIAPEIVPSLEHFMDALSLSNRNHLDSGRFMV